MKKSPRLRSQRTCVICKEPIPIDPITLWPDGNNAEPVAKGRCCDDCNNTVVIPKRLMALYNRKGH